ncbi:hypothetical protein HanOQP8_Chr13g0502711 [Helianthus annuus]|nr:hypothetical protein HanOQP8_Chr13g0502711 [Helianthus annuus]
MGVVPLSPWPPRRHLITTPPHGCGVPLSSSFPLPHHLFSTFLSLLFGAIGINMPMTNNILCSTPELRRCRYRHLPPPPFMVVAGCILSRGRSVE